MTRQQCCISSYPWCPQCYLVVQLGAQEAWPKLQTRDLSVSADCLLAGQLLVVIAMKAVVARRSISVQPSSGLS